jgi:hypothetical protein
MKRPNFLIIAVVCLFVLFMLGGFGSRASNSKHGNRAVGSPSPIPPSSSDPDKRAEASAKAGAAGPATQSADGEDEDSDPDLGKFQSTIDRDKYLRMRDEFIALKRGIEPGRPFDPRARGRAIEQMQGQESEASGKNSIFGSIANFLGIELNAGPSWTPLGPAPLFLNGSGNPASSFSGRVTAVVVDPTNPNIVYLGAAQGGVWRSLDGGGTWNAIFDNAQSLAIGALALAPSDHTVLYVGTGEFNGCGDCFFGAGLYRIDNADTSATLVGPINPSQTIGNLTYNIFSGRSISKILVHPTDPNTIFVATGSGSGGSGANALGGIPPMATRGVYRSINAKAAAASVTFQKLVVTTDNSFDNPATGNATISDMVMETGNPDHILVGVLGNGAGSSGVYQTTNATAATPGFTQALSLAAGVRVQLAINKTGSVVTAYAATSETPVPAPAGTGCSSTSAGSLHKSTNPFDAGATWSGQIAGAAGFCQGQCFYDMPIAVDPGDPNVVYVGGQSGSSPSLVCGGAVRKSTDGGNTFSTDGTGLHADEHAFFFDGAGNIYTGNDGGIWKRSANSAAGSAWTNLNHAGLNTLQFESVSQHPTDQFLTIGGTQDNGTEAQQTSSGNWKNAEGGDGGYTLIDQSATDNSNVTMYLTMFNQSNTQILFDRATLTSCLSVINSWPTRGTFTCGTPPAPCPENNSPASNCDSLAFFKNNGLQLTDNVLFYAPMALGPGTPNIFYFGTDRLYRSTDKGDNMTIVGGTAASPLISTGQTRCLIGQTCPPGTAAAVGTPISTIGISPQDDNYRLVGMQTGQVFATSTGSPLVDITGSFPSNPSGSLNRFVGRAVFDPNNKDVAYIAFSFYAPAGQGIWKITNLTAAVANPAAANWVASGNGIPSIPINALAIDPAKSNNIYAGTDIGVYFSTDGGANWAPYGNGLPRVSVFDMKLQNANRILRVATHGRGIWEASIGAVATPTPTPITYSVSGRIADAGNNAVSGVTVLFELNFQGTLTTRSTQTDANGNFSSGDVGCQNNVKVTPSKIGYAFSPQATAFVSSPACLTGTGTANFTATPQPANVLIEEGTANTALALDSVTFVRGPFTVVGLHNFSADQRTRVILFTSNLGLIQPDPSVLTVKAGSTPLTVENVGTVAGVAGLNASYIVVVLPNGLPAGDLPVTVTFHGVASSNTPTITISP